MKVRQEEPVRPGEVVHGYRIERKLGQGGFSQVYLAWQGERPYALKFTHLEHAREWAKRELHILLDFQHANVVRLVGHVQGPVEAREYLVLVMEYVPGRTLYQWAEEENPPAREVARRVRKLCRALAAMHAAQVLHRDLKGENVLVRDVGEALEAMLAEADASWDVPLCYGWDEAGLSTQNAPELAPLDAEELWRRWARKKPRRGRKALPADVPAPAAAPSARVSPERPVRTEARSRLLLAAGVSGLLVVGLGGDHPRPDLGSRRDTPPPSMVAAGGPALAVLLRPELPGERLAADAWLAREVAPPWKPPEAGAGAAPARVDTPAPVVTVTTLRKGETRLKKTEHKALGTQQERGLGAELARLCIGAAAAANAACATAPPVRPRPEPQACPPGAEEAMTERFALRHIAQDVYLPEANLDDPQPIPVREGPVTVFLGAPWDSLPSRSLISGRLVFGPERVYGRFTEARLPSGETVPVCFALWSAGIDRKPGLLIEGTAGPESVKVFPFGELRPVDRFE